MITYLLTPEGIEDPVMADGTTAFSMALAKGRSDLIMVFLQHKRTSDMKLAVCAALEPNINANVKRALIKSIKVHQNCILQLCFKPVLDFREFQVQLQSSRE